MFDVGFWELVVIGVIALLVVGPERLPKMARTVGLWVGKVRFYVSQVKDDIDREVRKEELKELLGKPSEFDDIYSMAEDTKGRLDEVRSAIAASDAEMSVSSDFSGAPVTAPAAARADDATPQATESDTPVGETDPPASTESDERRSEPT